MKTIKLLIPSLLLASNLLAITLDNGIKLSANKDENNNIYPDIILPIKYNDKYSSSFQYLEDKSIVENETVTNTTTSDKDTTVEHKLLRLNILNYTTQKNKTKFYFGFGLQKENFDKSQLGFAQTGATNINFDHKINIETSSIYLKSDFVFYGDKFDNKLKLNIVPSSDLEVTQNTVLSDGVNSTGFGSSKKSQDLSYELSYETMSKYGELINFGFEVRYRFLPLKYDLKLANSNSTYTDKNYDVEEKTTYIAGKIYFDKKIFNLMPTIGISSEKTNGLNKLDNKTYDKKETKILFGLNSKF